MGDDFEDAAASVSLIKDIHVEFRFARHKIAYDRLKGDEARIGQFLLTAQTAFTSEKPLANSVLHLNINEREMEFLVIEKGKGNAWTINDIKSQVIIPFTALLSDDFSKYAMLRLLGHRGAKEMDADVSRLHYAISDGLIELIEKQGFVFGNVTHADSAVKWITDVWFDQVIQDSEFATVLAQGRNCPALRSYLRAKPGG